MSLLLWDYANTPMMLIRQLKSAIIVRLALINSITIVTIARNIIVIIIIIIIIITMGIMLIFDLCSDPVAGAATAIA